MHLIRPLLIALGILVLSLPAFAQKEIAPSEQILITGEVTTELVVTLADIAAMPAVKIKTIHILNHKGERKGSLEGLRGVPVKQILKPMEIKAASPKVLSEYYFVFEASDGYKVVFSWNELFNSDAGDHVYLLTEMDGVPIADMQQRIALVTPDDQFTGRRYVKCLAKITVAHVQ